MDEKSEIELLREERDRYRAALKSLEMRTGWYTGAREIDADEFPILRKAIEDKKIFAVPCRQARGENGSVPSCPSNCDCFERKRLRFPLFDGKYFTFPKS